MSQCGGPGMTSLTRRRTREPSLPSVLSPACPAAHCVCSVRRMYPDYQVVGDEWYSYYPDQCQVHHSRTQYGLVGGRGREYDVSSMDHGHHHVRRRHRSGRVEDPQPSLTKSEPPSPGHSCYSEETRAGAETWQEEATAGCCSLQQTAPDLHNLISAPPTTSKEPLLSNCVKNFMSWMAEKAEKGTSAFLDSLPSLSKEDFHIVMIGLDGAGKTTALYRLKFDQYMNTVPTVGFNCERVKGTVGKSKGLTFLIWDVGGQERIRPLWRSYTRCTDGIIFVIDSSEEDNLDEAKLELWRTMKYQDNRDIPLLVLANKQDLQTALTGPDIEAALGLGELASTLWHVEESCSVTGEGLDTGLDQLCHLIHRRRKLNKRKRNKTK